MPRKWATVKNAEGGTYRVRQRVANHLVECGDYELVSANPMVLQQLLTKEYRDEVRRCSGRIVTGIAKMPFNCGQSSTSGYRVKPPRPQFDFWTWLNHDEDSGWADVKKEKAQRRIARYMKEQGK